MLKGIHKKTDKIVSAYKIENDSSWIGAQDDEWIAPRPEIYNWNFLKEKNINEVKVIFIKSHKRKYKNKQITPVIAHFRIECKQAIPNPENESEEHKLAKEAIYEKIINNKIFIEGKKIRDLFEIEDLDFEMKLSKSKKSKIADVIAIFKETDERFGKGIIFEIQFSHQNKEIKEERTYDRILEGYSVVWLHKKDFKNNNLIESNVLVIPYLNAIKAYRCLSKIEWEENIRDYGNLLDEKLDFSINSFDNHFKKTIQKFEEDNEVYKVNEKARREINEKKIEEEKEHLLNKLKDYISTLNQKEDIAKIIVNSIDYERLIEIFTEKEIISNDINKQLNIILKDTIKDIKKRMEKDIEKKLQNEIIPSIIEDYGNKLEGEVFCRCHSCNIKFSIRSMEFEGGWAYCQDCSNKLEDNWKIREEEKRQNFVQEQAQKKL